MFKKCPKCKIQMCRATTHNGWFCTICKKLWVRGGVGIKWKPMIKEGKEWVFLKKPLKRKVKKNSSK